jgi:hypothetical protein
MPGIKNKETKYSEGINWLLFKKTEITEKNIAI